MLEYGEPVQAVAVLIYETYNPGAVTKLSAVSNVGRQTALWIGKDPTDRSAAKGISVIPLKKPTAIRRLRIDLDSREVQGWNEIDAVGLVDQAGKTHWAASATASSSYAQLSTDPLNSQRVWEFPPEE